MFMDEIFSNACMIFKDPPFKFFFHHKHPFDIIILHKSSYLMNVISTSNAGLPYRSGWVSRGKHATFSSTNTLANYQYHNWGIKYKRLHTF